MRHPCRDWIAGVCPGEAQPGCRADRCGEQNGDRQGRPCLNTGSPAAITTMAQFGEQLLRQQQQPSQVLRILELAEPAGVSVIPRLSHATLLFNFLIAAMVAASAEAQCLAIIKAV